MTYPKPIEHCIEQLMKLPGIGRRGAERIVFWALDHDAREVDILAHSLVDLKKQLKFCRVSNNLTDQDVDPMVTDSSRDPHILCVVENPKDLLAIEATGTYRGQYYVLLGTVSPGDGRGPDDLNLNKLMRRLHDEDIREVVIATDADTEGEMTALHLMKVLKPTGVKISRIGVGIPMGSSVEYADISTLSMALSARRVVES